MSRDGRRVAFATWIDGRNVVVEDGTPGERFDSVSWPLAMSEDGKVVAYAARQGSDQYCVAARRRSRPYRAVAFPVVSASGEDVAFAASRGSGWFVVRNDREGEAYDWVGNLTLHPGGRSLAYTAETHADGVRAFVVFNGRAGPGFDRVTKPSVSGDGSRVAYGGRRKGQWFLVVGDREIPVRDEIASVVVSDDGRQAAYVVEDQGRRHLVAPSGPGARFEWIGWPAFARDGRLVYLASRGRMKFLVAGDREIELGDGIVWDLEINPEGSRVGFGARIGDELYWKSMPLPPSGSGHTTVLKGGRPCRE